jgi:hypothetical protein
VNNAVVDYQQQQQQFFHHNAVTLPYLPQNLPVFLN